MAQAGQLLDELYTCPPQLVWVRVQTRLGTRVGMAAESMKKVKILVLGDTGVGKTSLVHRICHREPLSNPAWTVGCSVEVKVHEYHRSTTPTDYFLEFWDVGGSPAHRKGCGVFYQQANGIILVHDLTNRKSFTNLSKWLSDCHQRGEGGATSGLRRISGRRASTETRGGLDYDPEQFADQELPIIIVGTKQDQVPTSKVPSSSSVAGAKYINVDCTNSGHFEANSPQSAELLKFFDKVIERRYFPSLHMVSGYAGPHPQQGSSERHRSAGKRTSLN